jgi:3-oxoadipate enol-lactonase
MAYAFGRHGNRIYYERRGDVGPWVVLIQGLGLSSRFWFDQPERLLAATPPYRVLLLDNRGVGRSDRASRPFRVADMADDVAAAMRAASIPRAYVVGISLGGMIAQEVALRHPKLVDGLVLLATTPGLPHGRLPTPRAVATLLSLPLRSRSSPAKAVAQILLSPKHLPDAKTLLSKWPAAFALEPRDARAFFTQFGAVLRHSTGGRLHRIQCPTVVVGGGADMLVPAANSEFLARKIPHAMLEVLPDIAHGIPVVDEQVVERSLAKLRRGMPSDVKHRDRPRERT